MTCGLRQAGVEVMAGVDLAEECESTYEANNPGTKFVGADITKLEENYFEKQFGLIRNDDNLVLVGCSPCQYYSIINTSRDKSLKSKDLLRDFKRFADYYNPGFILVENVPGLATRQDSVLPELLAFRVRKGYHY